MTVEYCPRCSEPWPQALAYPMELIRCPQCRLEKKSRMAAWEKKLHEVWARQKAEEKQ